MKAFLAGTAINLPVEFKVRGDLVAPDKDSLQVWLYGSDGVAIAGWEPKNVAIDGTKTIAPIEISATDNDPAVAGTIEKRTVLCVFQVGGATHQVGTSYLLTPFLNFTASPEDVMAYFGLREGEVSPDSIDMVDAYLEAAAILTKTTLDSQLAAAGTMLRANRLIMLLAARRVLPSLRFAVNQLAKSDRTQFERYRTMDWVEIERRLNAEIDSATGVESSATSAIFSKVTPTDPITGV